MAIDIKLFFYYSSVNYTSIMKNNLVIGDTDALISTINKDAHHETVIALFKEFAKQNVAIYFPSAIIAETITTCQRRLKNQELAKAMVKQLTYELIDTVQTDSKI